ncbi:hypothetical protein T01_1721 [Trichinella spiralis]|uniref:Uncharacterized protein n=1 Tax=Trichinella spiralis TaxID=6334 RepID=A0A0V1BTR8_TRISP|nr:hypothetical protein T01_1721 [Trichinella spiralis]
MTSTALSSLPAGYHWHFSPLPALNIGNRLKSLRDPLSCELVRHPNRVISALVAKRRRAGVDRLVSLSGHLCYLPPALLLFPLSSRFPDDIIPIGRQTESIVLISNYEQGLSTTRHKKLCKPTTTTRSQESTHYRNPPLIFKDISSYGIFILLPLCCLDKYSC